jgi:hypothetical protein
MLAACHAAAPEKQVEALVCPELAGEADLLQMSFTADPAANGRIRAFVAAARALYDATSEMERLAQDACRRMTSDIGVPVDASARTLEHACAPVLRAINHVFSSGIQLKVAIAEPRCGTDANREQQCGSLCGSDGAECRAMCKAQAAIYAQCSMPSVSVAVSGNFSEAIALAKTLERNLPSLLYAELALGRRLAAHAEAIVRVSMKLPNDIQGAEPRGIACVALAATTTGKSVAHLEALLSTSSALTARWEAATALIPEVPQ